MRNAWFFRSLAAFANAEGGLIVWGFEDETWTPKEIENLGDFEKSIHRTLDQIAQGRKLRFTAEMLLWDLRNEMRGFERFDGANKGVLVDSCYRILSRLEALTDDEAALRGLITKQG